MSLEAPCRERLVSDALADAISTEALTGEPVNAGLEGALSIGEVVDNCGGVCGGGKSTSGGIGFDMSRYDTP